MNSVRKKNPKRFGEWIDPESVSGKTGMTKGAERKNFATRTAETRIDVPSKPATHRVSGRRLHARHQLDSFGFENANSVELALIEKHSGVTSEVSGGRKYSRV